MGSVVMDITLSKSVKFTNMYSRQNHLFSTNKPNHMNRTKLLICLLASISIVGITSIEISSANKGTNKSSDNIASIQEPKIKELRQEFDDLKKELEKIDKNLKSKDFVETNISWIIPLSFIFNLLATLGGLVYLVYRTKKIAETVERRNNSINGRLDKKLDRPDRDPFSTKSDLNKLVEKQQKIEFSVSSLEREISTFQKETKTSLSILTANIRDASSRNKNIVPISNNQQSHDSLMNYYPSENIEPAYLTDYNDRQKNFADTYRSLVVDRDPDNYNLSRAGQTEEVILTEESRGNYWLFSHDGLTYVVPSQKLKIREDKLNEVKDLFDCENYQGFNYDNYTLIKPALVSKKANGIWRLKEKGNLQFG
jgi:cell division protein FtsB